MYSEKPKIHMMTSTLVKKKIFTERSIKKTEKAQVLISK